MHLLWLFAAASTVAQPYERVVLSAQHVQQFLYFCTHLQRIHGHLHCVFSLEQQKGGLGMYFAQYFDTFTISFPLDPASGHFAPNLSLAVPLLDREPTPKAPALAEEFTEIRIGRVVGDEFDETNLERPFFECQNWEFGQKCLLTDVRFNNGKEAKIFIDYAVFETTSGGVRLSIPPTTSKDATLDDIRDAIQTKGIIAEVEVEQQWAPEGRHRASTIQMEDIPRILITGKNGAFAVTYKQDEKMSNAVVYFEPFTPSRVRDWRTVVKEALAIMNARFRYAIS